MTTINTYFPLLCASFGIFCFQAIAFYLNPESKFIWFNTLLISTLMGLYYLFRFLPITVMIFFFSLYFYTPKYFFVDELYLSHHLYNQNAESINFISILNSMFLIGIFLGIGKLNHQIKKLDIYGKFNEKTAFWLLYILCLIIPFIGQTGSSIFVSGYGSAEKSTLFEYFIVFYFLLYLLADRKSNIQDLALWAIFFIYISRSLLFGGRVEVVIISLLTLYIRYDFMRNRSIQFFILAGLGIMIMQLIAVIRTSPWLAQEIFSGNLISTESIIWTIQTQYGDVYQASLRIIGLLSEGFITTNERITSLFSVIFGFFPSSWLPEVYNLANYLRNVATTGGGGLVSAYSYVWLGGFGPSIFGIMIGMVIRFGLRKVNYYLGLYCLLLLTFFPRWFAYYPTPLFKVMLVPILILLILSALKLIRENKKQNA